ncbi:MAG: DUF3060 domain-containing protein [Myxococcales bacterium]|nr:DUF3060 domain-containing protein [Myxococcales bacterium]MCB9671544.1 DUF3060 domain-containing protein [Alphaproteobacteria bacterium]MCB9691865.1 DUF3060 domain-containing protein [Alphaproteobacteria bacterium]
MSFLLLALPALAGTPHVIQGAGLQKTHACSAGQDITVQGSAHELVLTGDCGVVDIQGASNEVKVDGVARLVVSGSMNKVVWSRNLSGQPKLPIQKTGTMNEVTHAPPPAAAPLVITGAGGAKNASCSPGQAVSVSGSNLAVTLTGDCGKLEVDGSSNAVAVDGVASVHVTGTSNKVTWARNLSGQSRLPTSTEGVMNEVGPR